MKRSVVWILLSYSLLGLAGIPVRAQETKPEKENVVVEPGNDFRAALEKGVRLKAPGQPITAKLLEPVYAERLSRSRQAQPSRDMFLQLARLRKASVREDSWMAT
jgi:hypothetical protein